MKVKKFLQRLLFKSSESELEQCYQSIDSLPIYNWFKIFETQELKYLIIKGTPTEKQLNDLWEKLFNEYISVFGLDESFKNYFKHTKKVLDLEVKYALTKKGSYLFKLEYEKAKYKALNPTTEDKDNFMINITKVEQKIGRTIDEHSISVLKYYSYIKQL